MNKYITMIAAYITPRLNTVYKKLVILTLVCSLIPLLLTSSISYIMAYTMSKNRTVDSLRSANRQFAININNRMEQVENLSNSISFYLYNLHKIPHKPLSDYLSAYSHSKNNIGSIKSTFNLFQITVFLPEDSMLSPNGNGIDFFPLKKLADYNMTEQQLVANGSRACWQANKDLKFPEAFSATPKTVMTCWSAYRNVNNGSLNYAFACHLRLSDFSSLLHSAIDSSGSSSYIINSEQQILVHQDERQIGTVVDTGPVNLWEVRQDSLTWNNFLYVTQPLANESMLLVTQIPLSYIRQSSNFILTSLLLSIILMITCAIFLSISVSKSFTQRIQTLTQVMEVKKSDKSNQVLSLLQPMIERPDNHKDEIDKLAGTYQVMVLENDHYFEQILEMSLQTEKLKYQLLQSQINPHFLFNTLNSITSCQALGKIELARQTITNLSQFYRQLLYDPDHLVTIREELNVTELYLNLICVSKTNKITWEFDIEDGIEHFQICKFIFQPFMENAVIHGITDSITPLHICISIRYEEDSLLIQITDNGAGIHAKRLNDIRATLNMHQADYDKNYGISNVNVRLTPFFANGYDQILVDSRPGDKTTFTIHLKLLL